jgi:tetratricopeptide (TPR) repeat protein
MKTLIRNLAMVLALTVSIGAMAQSKYGATPEDSVTCVQNLSLYQEFMKQGAYKDAYGPWREVLRVCPGSSKGAYQNGIKLLTTFIDEEKDPARKTRLIDSLNVVYDLRIANFGEEAFVLGRKGVDMLIYTPDRCESAYDALSQSVEQGGARSEAGALSGYYQALKGMCTKGAAPKDQMVTDYVKIMGLIEANLNDPNRSEVDKSYYEQARDNVNTLFFQVAECGDIGRIATQLVTEKPEDLQLKERMLKVLNAKDCTDEKIYRSLAEDVHRADPSSESAYSLGMFLAKQNDMGGAMRYMKEAVDLCSGCTDKVKYLMKAGQVASASGNHSQARSYANQVLQLDAKNGEAMLLIGIAIESMAGGCEAPDSWGVHWLAYDYYQRAKSLDPSVADKASSRMGSAAARFPTQSEAFFHQLTDGKPYQVSCGGLNETTTVRTRK